MRQKHSIDLLFSLSLFTVFVICSFLVLLLQTGSYKTIIEKGEKLESIHTPLAYLSSIIRSHDQSNQLQLQNIEGVTVLTAIDDDGMITYIYQRDHSLMELQMVDDVQPDLAAGTALFPIKAFQVSMKDQKIHLSIEDEYNQQQKLILRLHKE